jgi:hypothetical protein
MEHVRKALHIIDCTPDRCRKAIRNYFLAGTKEKSTLRGLPRLIARISQGTRRSLQFAEYENIPFQAHRGGMMGKTSTVGVNGARNLATRWGPW